MAQHSLCVRPEALREVLDRMMDIVRVKSRIPDRTDLLFVRKDRKCRVFRILCPDLRHQSCVRADAVILAVSSHKSAVKSDIDCLVCRDHLDLRTGEIFFRDPVALVQ